MATWLLDLPLEFIILSASLDIYSSPHRQPVIGDHTGGWLVDTITPFETIDVAIDLVRIALVIGLLVVYGSFALAARAERKRLEEEPSSGDTTPLLADHPENSTTDAETGTNGHMNGQTYGTVQAGNPDQTSDQATKDKANGGVTSEKGQKKDNDAWAKPTEAPSVGWFQYIRGYGVLLPYLWPSKSRKLQMIALFCFALTAAQRVLQIAVPILAGLIVNRLTEVPVRPPWPEIILYMFLRWLQGSQGGLSVLRSICWIPVEQYSFRAITQAAFEHVHGLSAEFHTDKKTGEVISALNKGSSINSFLSYITFNMGPMFVDMIITIIYVSRKYDAYICMTMTISTSLYVYVTVRIAQTRVQLRRDTANADRDMEAVK